METKYPRWERILIAILSFIVFTIIGVVVRFFVGGPITLFPISQLLIDILPMALGIGILAAVLAFAFPRVFSVILWFVPSIELN